MDIHSKSGYPASTLSNFSPHPFIIDGIQCNSMEGFLQSLKFKNQEMQIEVCKLVGLKAKFKGKKKNWWKEQILYWLNKEIKRDSEEYQNLLNRAYQNLYNQSDSFRRALHSTKGILTHSIGNTNIHRTVLTQQEFTSRLMKLREGGILWVI